MKKLFGVCGALLAALFLCPVQGMAAAGGQLTSDSYLPIPQAAAYSSTFSVRADGIRWASAQIVVTSVTQPAQTFTDGSISTANVTINSYAALSTAAATGAITVSSNPALTGACISGGGPNLGSFNVCNPAQWAIGNVSSNTACNIAAAIQTTGIVLSTCGFSAANVVTTSATYVGAAWNQFQLSVSTAGALTVSNLISSSPATNVGIGAMVGGHDNATLTVNGTTLQANRDWYPITSNAATATSLATAITNSSVTTNVVAAAGSQSTTVVFATSTIIGAGTNYALSSSSQAILSVSSPVVTGATSVLGYGTGSTTMFGGTGPAYVVGTSTISVPSNNFGSGEAVYITTGTNFAVPIPLAWGTTYYVITIPPNSITATPSIELATTQANALANVPIVLTSSATKGTADSFILNVPAIAGAPSVVWAASNDGSHWMPYLTTPFNLSVSSVSYGTYYSTGSVNNMDFGHYNYGYIGLSVTAPTSGAINVGAHIVGNAP